jgi:diadenosine tetraphosphate (Ap4A) HIT family hydrolase
VKTDAPTSCELCDTPGGEVLWRDEFCRIVYVEEADYPGFCRVILQRHVSEMTDLPGEDRARLMQRVFAVETALRELLRPDKINLASLGNAVPHLHWHVIPRYRDDRHFPFAIWAQAPRPSGGSTRARPGPDRRTLAEHLQRHLG